MYAMNTVKQAALSSGLTLSNVSVNMGRTRQYVNAVITQGSTPRADTLARMLDVCGYGLYAIPYADAPAGALQVTYEGQEEHRAGGAGGNE